MSGLPDLPTYVSRHALFGRHGFPALEWTGRSLVGPGPVAGDALEIGAGNGVLSLWLLHAGARSVVSLEPEAAGAEHGVAETAARHREALGIPEARWTVCAETLQAYEPDGRRFSLVLSKSSINHLDEDACTRLPRDGDAAGRYRRIFRKIHDLLVPGGILVLADCARVNYWDRLLRRPSPWAPEIEWHKHQEPEVWARLAAEAGLTPIGCRFWHPFYRLRTLGPLLSWRPAARCLASYFVLRLRRPGV